MSEWIKFVKRTHAEMKKKDKNVKLKDTLIHCGKIWKSKSMAKTTKSATKSARKTAKKSNGRRKTRKNRKH
jgi:hypothetical protein